MISKIIKVTIAQIIMWSLACLADIVSYAHLNGKVIQYICFPIAPICFMTMYAIVWASIYLYDEKSSILKWIVQYGILLCIWCLETYGFMNLIIELVEANKWIIHQQGFVPWAMYFLWAIPAAIIPIISVVVHIVITVVKHRDKLYKRGHLHD